MDESNDLPGICDDDDDELMGLATIELPETLSIKTMSLNMWGSCFVKNFDKCVGENNLLKPLHLKLLHIVSEFLDSLGITWFVFCGTALSVWRENGKMIVHDYDTDLAILEEDFGTINSHLSDILKSGMVSVDPTCPRTGRTWFTNDGTEIPFDGLGAKRIKFFLNRSVWEMVDKAGKKALYAKRNDSDQGLVHLDLYTLRRLPSNNSTLCLNWHLPCYDPTKKLYLEDIFLPTKDYYFEGIKVKGPNKIKDYLKIEYGYLGRDAMYDSKQQCYVKIPSHLFEQLPRKLRDYMCGGADINNESH